MYCRYCGDKMDDGAVKCPVCETEAGHGDKHCFVCGEHLQPHTAVCPHCGVVLTPSKKEGAGTASKSRLYAALLGIFLGFAGAHSFYLGDKRKGVIQIVVTVLTFGAGYLWGFIEGILILAGVINTDAFGNPLAE